MDSPRRRLTSTVDDFDRARHSLFPRLLVLFVTTGLLGCAAPASDSYDTPASDESLDPAEDLDGKADRASSQRQLLPIPRVENAPSSLARLTEHTTRNVDWSRGHLVIEHPVDCLPLEVVTTGIHPYPHEGRATIFVTNPERNCDRATSRTYISFDLRPLLRAGAWRIALEDATGTIATWDMPSFAHKFWQSTWTHPLSCWSAEGVSGIIEQSLVPPSTQASLYNVRIDMSPWGGPSQAVMDAYFNGRMLTLLDANPSLLHLNNVMLERDSPLGLISGEINWGEKNHRVTCVELK